MSSSLSFLLLKFLPAFSYIALGYACKSWFSLSQTKVAQLLFYVFVPLVVFKGALLSDTGSFALLIALSFSVSLAMGFIAKLTTHYFRDILSEGVLKCLYSYFNIGWFGIPLVYALFGDEGAIIMTGLYVGGMLFGNTIGFLWVTHNQNSEQSSFKKLLGIPALYAMLLGVSLHFSHFFSALSAYSPLRTALDISTIATSVLGMGLVGMSVANISFKTVPWKKLTTLLFLRVVFTFLVVGTCSLLAHQFGWLSPMAIKVFLLMPLLPIAANILVFTAKAKQENEFVGLALLFSTILSCIFFTLWFAVF